MKFFVDRVIRLRRAQGQSDPEGDDDTRFKPRFSKSRILVTIEARGGSRVGGGNAFVFFLIILNHLLSSIRFRRIARM